ncbi:MAG: helix-turn-helix domain-containing protein [Anaerolineales bacterium]
MTDLSVSQVAALLNCSHRHVLNLIQRGAFPNAYKLDPNSRSRWRIPKKDVDQFIKQQRGK